MLMVLVFFFEQKTAYEMRISDWSSDVCSSDLGRLRCAVALGGGHGGARRAHARHARREIGRAFVSGKSVSVRVDLGGRSLIKKKKQCRTVMRKRHSSSNS